MEVFALDGAVSKVVLLKRLSGLQALHQGTQGTWPPDRKPLVRTRETSAHDPREDDSRKSCLQDKPKRCEIARLLQNRGNASVEILKTLRLCMALALVATSCRKQLATAAPRSLASPEAPVHLVVPEQGAYTGAYMDFGDTEDAVTLEHIEAFERAVGKRQAIVASSSYWGEQTFPIQNLEIITRHNAIPLIYWSPWDKPYVEDRGPDRFSLNAIVAGKCDSYIDFWAAQAKTSDARSLSLGDSK